MRVDQQFDCDELRQYDKEINKESHKKIQDCINENCQIKIGDIVQYGYAKQNAVILDIQLRQGSLPEKYSFSYIVAPANKKGVIIKNRKAFLVDDVIKDGVLYCNPSHTRSRVTAAQLRFDDYHYVHRRFNHY